MGKLRYRCITCRSDQARRFLRHGRKKGNYQHWCCDLCGITFLSEYEPKHLHVPENERLRYIYVCFRGLRCEVW